MIYEKKWILCLLILSVTGAYGCNQPKKQVCIIGGGVSGLVSANQLSSNLQDDFETIVFEKSSDIGGQWKYTDSTDFDEHGLPVHSSVYKNLRTNGPKIVMTIPNYQEFHGENRSYVKHETVLEYLRNYTDHFNLRQYIKFNTLVEKVTQMLDKRWLVKTRDLNCDLEELFICDAIMICNGHYTKPYTPIIPGLDTFPGRTLHSHNYRKPEEFVDQTVVILGASYSGIDIGIDLAKYAKTVYLSHRHDKITSELPKNVIQIAGVVAANGSDLILSDGSRIKVDSFLMCTGYLYDYPFLDESANITVTQGKYVHPLYKHMLNIINPTMAFIGILQPAYPFVIPFFEAEYFVSLLRGKAKLPSREVMLEESQLPPGTPAAKAHDTKTMEVFKYFDEIANAAGIDPLPESFKKTVVILAQDSQQNLLHYKENNFVIRDNGDVDLIWPNNEVKFVYKNHL